MTVQQPRTVVKHRISLGKCLGKPVRCLFSRFICIKQKYQGTGNAVSVYLLQQKPVIGRTAESHSLSAALNNTESVHDSLADKQGTAARHKLGRKVKNDRFAVLAVFIAAMIGGVRLNGNISHLICIP